MEKSWIFWNFEIFWKSHGILTKNGQGLGKVMEFLNWNKKSWKNHGILQTNFTNKFLILIIWRRYAAGFQNPTGVYVD